MTDDIQKQAGQLYMRCPRCGLILGQNTSAELCPHDDPACGACCSKYYRTDPVPENIVPFTRKESRIMPSASTPAPLTKDIVIARAGKNFINGNQEFDL